MRWQALALIAMLAGCSGKGSVDTSRDTAAKPQVPPGGIALEQPRPAPAGAEAPEGPRKLRKEDGTQCLDTQRQTGRGCDMEGIMAAVRPARKSGGAVQKCYRRYVRPPRKGKVQLKFALDPDGKAGGFEAPRDDFGSPALVDCLGDAMREISFPAPGDVPCQVVYPFTFVPEVRSGR